MAMTIFKFYFRNQVYSSNISMIFDGIRFGQIFLTNKRSLTWWVRYGCNIFKDTDYFDLKKCLNLALWLILPILYNIVEKDLNKSKLNWTSLKFFQPLKRSSSLLILRKLVKYTSKKEKVTNCISASNLKCRCTLLSFSKGFKLQIYQWSFQHF